ncbi:MAG: NAD-dependent succinate-semialdehyde dehydrogenase [Litorimonas sp.]
MKLNDKTLLRTQLYINGAWQDSQSGETFDVLNPANGDVVASVAKGGTAETSKAIDVAQTTYKAWQKVGAKERSAILMKWHDEIMANIDDLAVILTTEMGKPLAESRGEIAYGANYVKWFAEEAKRIYGDTIPSPAADKRVVVIKQPLGVVACITPWNFPNAMLARKIAPALAAGNTVVCKPANETPLSALALGELATRAGVPAGAINILCGITAQIGEELTSNPIVKKLSFTGSTGVGKMLTAQCSATMKRTSMELGGNAPYIVFNDADMDEAITGIMASKFRNAGQTCVCANRIFVQSGAYDTFVSRIKAEAEKLKVGDGNTDGTEIGPLVNAKAARDVRAIIQDALDKGATLTAGDTPDPKDESNFITPVVLTDVAEGMRVFTDEIFGPVAPVFKFETEEEVIALANDTPFGLAAYFYSRDIGRVWRVGEALEYGMVGINTGAISNEMAPFGGVKESGQGREGSKYGLDDYLEIKSLTMGGITS